MKRWCILAIALLTAVILSVTVSASSPITSIEFSNSNAVAEENLSLSGYGDKDGGYAASTLGGRLFASVSGTDLRKLEWSKGEYGTLGMQPAMTGGTKNPWGKGAYIEVRTSSTGYENITFSAMIGATNKGPCDYKLQYSLDGETFKDIPGAVFMITTNKTMFRAFDNVALPADAANADTLVIRIAVASNRMVNGTAGLIGSTGGETAINFVTVSGDKLASAATTATNGTTALATTATEPTVSTTVAATDPIVSNVDTGEGESVWLIFAVVLASVMTAVTLRYRAKE